ncbi:MAG TPA: hypothetical protein VGC74_17050 [Stenotrophomonas sp.]
MLPSPIRRIAVLLFDDGLLRLIFEHVRNVAVSSLITAAGLEVARVSPSESEFTHPGFAGYSVAAIGMSLLVLNLLDGLWKLSRLKSHVLLQCVLCVSYALISWRVAQLVLSFKLGVSFGFTTGS